MNLSVKMEFIQRRYLFVDVMTLYNEWVCDMPGTEQDDVEQHDNADEGHQV